MFRTMHGLFVAALTLALASSAWASWDFGDAPDPTYPSLMASGGPFHADVSMDWLGPGPVSTTTVEQDSLQINADFDDGNVAYVRGLNRAWFCTQVSYNPAVSPATDLRYLNVLVDRDASGSWSNNPSLDEWMVRNYRVPFDRVPAGVTTLNVAVELPAGCDPALLAQSTTRVTLTPDVVHDGVGAWGGFLRGETEDYCYGTSGHDDNPIPIDPPGGQKLKGLVANGEADWFPNNAWGRCPHGRKGVITGLCPNHTNPARWRLNVPNGVTSLKMTLTNDGGCPRCCDLCPQSAVLDGAGGVVAVLNAGPGPELVGGGVLAPGAANWFDSWFGFPDTPGHDRVKLEYDMVFDPAGEYWAVQGSFVGGDPEYEGYGSEWVPLAVPEPCAVVLLVMAGLMGLLSGRRPEVR